MANPRPNYHTSGKPNDGSAVWTKALYDQEIDGAEMPFGLDSACYYLDLWTGDYNEKLRIKDDLVTLPDHQIRLLQVEFAPTMRRLTKFIMGHHKFKTVLSSELRERVTTAFMWWSALEAELKQEGLL